MTVGIFRAFFQCSKYICGKLVVRVVGNEGESVKRYRVGELLNEPSFARLVLVKGDAEAADKGLSYYAVSLAFNFAWSIVFFNLRWFLFAFFWLLILLYLIIRTILCYKKVSTVAAYLQIPYVIWVAFAGYLNFGIWWLNR